MDVKGLAFIAIALFICALGVVEFVFDGLLTSFGNGVNMAGLVLGTVIIIVGIGIGVIGFKKRN